MEACLGAWQELEYVLVMVKEHGRESSLISCMWDSHSPKHDGNPSRPEKNYPVL